MTGLFSLHCDPKWLKMFRSEAKKRFPREIYGVFLGEMVENRVLEVEKLVICPFEITSASQWEVAIPNSWLQQVAREAKLAGLQPLGDIHTHCSPRGAATYAEPVPSKGDWDSLHHFRRLLGPLYSFMSVMSLNAGRKRLRSDVKFFPVGQEIDVVWRKDD